MVAFGYKSVASLIPIWININITSQPSWWKLRIMYLQCSQKVCLGVPLHVSSSVLSWWRYWNPILYRIASFFEVWRTLKSARNSMPSTNSVWDTFDRSWWEKPCQGFLAMPFPSRTGSLKSVQSIITSVWEKIELSEEPFWGCMHTPQWEGFISHIGVLLHLHKHCHF